MTCGIYQIVHLRSGMRYIGQSRQIEEKRWTQHRWLLRHGEHDYPEMQAAWDADGEEAFAFDILEPMPYSTKAERHKREDAWRYFYREWLFKPSNGRGIQRQRRPKDDQMPMFLGTSRYFVSRRMHLGPPNGVKERRHVMYSGRRDHYRLLAIRVEAQTLQNRAVANSPANHVQVVLTKPARTQPWRFPPQSVPESLRQTGSYQPRSDRRSGLDRRKA